MMDWTIEVIKWINVSSNLLAILGTLILFVFGVPDRIKTGGAGIYLYSDKTPEGKRKDKRDTIFGYIGTIFLIGAAFLQIVIALN